MDNGSGISNLTVVVGPGQPAGPIPLSVADAGGRAVTLVNPTQVVPMDLGGIQLADAIIAGGGDVASLVVTNNGNVTSPATPIDYSVQSGVQVASIETSAGVCSPAPPQGCLLPPVDPGATETVRLTLTVDPAAPRGPSRRHGDHRREDHKAVAERSTARSSPSTRCRAAPTPPVSPATVDLHVATRLGAAAPFDLTVAIGEPFAFLSTPDGCSAVGDPPTQQLTCPITLAGHPDGVQRPDAGHPGRCGARSDSAGRDRRRRASSSLLSTNRATPSESPSQPPSRLDDRRRRADGRR